MTSSSLTLASEVLKGNLLHRSGTIVVSLSGHGAAAKSTPAFIARALAGLAGVPIGAIASLHRYNIYTSGCLTPEQYEEAKQGSGDLFYPPA